MPESRDDVSSWLSFKESNEAFKAGDGSSLKQEDKPLEAEAKRFKSSHKVKESVSPDPEALDRGEHSDEALNSFFGSIDTEVPIFIEACAGCGVLSSVAKERGFSVIPIDCPRNKHKAKAKLVVLDLTSKHAAYIMDRLLEDFNVCAVHFGLPCGTCSKARGIPLADGSAGPPPLRSFAFLHGLPNLSPLDQAKVAAANALYSWADVFIQKLHAKNIIWTIENPGNSWLWELPEMTFAIQHGKFTYLHPCAYGGERKKNTAFLASDEAFSKLEKFCDGSHPHAQWGYDEEKGVFNTSKEAEYPRQLCVRYVDALVEALEAKGISLDALNPREKRHPDKQKSGRISTQLISEYERTTTIFLDAVPPVDNKKCLLKQISGIPSGSKLLRTEAKAGKTMCIFGIYRSMEAFVYMSRQLSHPFDELKHFPDSLIKCIFDTLTLGLLEITKRRILTLNKWMGWAKELAHDEVNIRKHMDDKVSKILQGKRLLLLEKIAGDIGWPDVGLHAELREGFKITGYAKPCGVFKREVKIATMDKEHLMQESKYLRPALLGKARSTVSSDEDTKKLFEITCNEAGEKSWLEGPYNEKEISERLGLVWLPVRRFGIWQKNKLRPIDDFRENKLNESFSSGDKLDLQAMDQLLWTMVTLMVHCKHCGSVDFVLSNGERLSGPLHNSWSSANLQCEFTAFDLESAYKQLPLHPEERNCSVVTLKHPEKNEPACFLMNTLPFGSVASVLHFNRTARLLWRIGLELHLLWFNYFDDYPCATFVEQRKSTLGSVRTLFDILGFRFAEDKLAPFDRRAEMLGVEVDLTHLLSDRVIVDNKTSRKDELCKAIKHILSEGCIVPSAIPSLLGRLQFADLQLMGRTGKLAMADIREMMTSSDKSVALQPDVIAALEVLQSRMSCGKPRTLHIDRPKAPVVVFTDGAFEPIGDGTFSATVGGVLIPRDGPVRVFGCRVNSKVLDRWLQVLVHPIGLIELYAIGVAFKTWGEFLHDEKSIFFCDNWAALDVFVKGSSTEPLWRSLLLDIEIIDMETRSLMWLSRVPSASNIADPPSRGSLDELTFLEPICLDQAFCPCERVSLEPVVSKAERGDKETNKRS